MKKRLVPGQHRLLPTIISFLPMIFVHITSVSNINGNGVPAESFQTETFHSNLEQKGDKKISYRITESYLSDNSKILDFGCGKCEFFGRIKGKFNNLKLVGFDIDKYYVDLGRKKGYCVYNSLDELKEKFDYVICGQVIEHLTVDKASLFFKQSGKFLNGGGKLIISTLNANEFYNIIDIWNDPSHVRLYPIIALRTLAEQNGFRLVKVYKYGARTNPIKIITNLLLGMSVYTGITLVFEKS